MVIGFDGSRAFVNDKTGTENYSYQLLKALSKIDRKNKYIVYLRPGKTPNEKLPENFQLKSIKFPRLWTQVGLAKQTFLEKLDLLFVPAHTSPLIHKPGLKTVVTAHDLGVEYLPKMHQLKQRVYLKWVTNFQLKSATKLIAVSEATKKDLVNKIGISPSRIEVIYEGFDQGLFKPVAGDKLDTDLKQFNIKKQGYFLFVGTIQPRKNLEKLIKAFQEFVSSDPFSISNTETKLVIVGSKGWLSDEIYALPKKLGIEEKIKFLGRVEDSDLPALYSGAAAFVYPSLFEGFGLPILEAQACGCPVITSGVSSMPEVAGKGAILVDPTSTEAIIKALIEVQNQDHRSKLIKNGLENIKRFSWEKCAQKTLELFETL